NLGPDGWKDVTTNVGLDKIQLKGPRAIITGDYDNDGTTDLLITQNHGPAVLLKNEGGNKNNWLRLALKGLNSNKSAIGTKVEVFSDGIRQKYEIYGFIGHWVAPGERNIPRSTEWVKIDPNVIRGQEGAPSLSGFTRQGGEVDLQETKRQISHPLSLTNGETTVGHPSVLSFRLMEPM